MITDKFVLFLLCLFGIMVETFGQDKRVPTLKIVDGVWYDVDDVPRFKLQQDSTKAYWVSPINSVADFAEFQGGHKQFKQCADSLYFTRWKEYGADELNSYVYFALLFDSNMKIIQACILLKFYKNVRYRKYDELVKWMLYSTEGRWKKRNSHSKYKYYWTIGLYRLV